MSEKLTFAGGYGRIGTTHVQAPDAERGLTCDRCKSPTNPVLVSDGSEGEYSASATCLPCIQHLFDAFTYN